MADVRRVAENSTTLPGEASFGPVRYIEARSAGESAVARPTDY
jgi:hypothetical protein